MHRKKALYHTASVVLCTVLGIVAIVMGLRQNVASELAWAGAAVTTLGYAAFFGWLHMFSIARTRRFPAVLVVATLVGSYDAFFAVGVPAQQWPARAIAVVGLACTLAYLFWYSTLGRRPSRIVRGQVMPTFDAKDVHGATITSSTLAEGTPALFIFTRGNWSALCTAQVREIVEWLPRIARQGAKVVVVSPQPARRTAALARDLAAPQGDVTFLVDEGAAAARALGILHENGVPAGVDAIFGRDTVFPTLVITDEHGVVRFVDETNEDRARPHPKRFLGILDELAAARAAAASRPAAEAVEVEVEAAAKAKAEAAASSA